MMQQINLYQPGRHAGPSLAAANGYLAMLIIAVLLMGVYYAIGLWQFNQARQEVARLEIKNGELSNQRDTLSEQVQQMQPSVALETEVSRLEGDLEAKRKVQKLLNGDTAGNRAGFSQHLEGLARHPLKGLWLTGVSIENGGRQLGLRGNALSAELLPRYLETLRDEAAFAGREFRSLNMNRPVQDSTSIEFQLRTLADEGESR
ncbi:MAG: hypothetical protein DWQ09_07045 [Proteobacteria bacterium]|nr:MAG: hypothetical protein DWQ09_07045 [Pseudomonadota bacterium]QKK10506.1 MAG: hypothetical protein HND59_01665 [Pseudomonadota bacterium]